MKKFAMITMILVLGNCFTAYAAEGGATKAECMAKTREAAEIIQKEGLETAIAQIRDKNGRFVWKDSYVFLMDMEGRMLAHPMNPALAEKKSLLAVTDKNIENPKQIFVEFVAMAKTSGEGWVDYVWPKPGEKIASVKETHIYRVPGGNMFVGAGIYK